MHCNSCFLCISRTSFLAGNPGWEINGQITGLLPADINIYSSLCFTTLTGISHVIHTCEVPKTLVNFISHVFHMGLFSHVKHMCYQYVFHMWRVTCEKSHVKFPMRLLFTWEVSHGKFHMWNFTCGISHGKFHMWNFTCEISHVKFHTENFTCEISRVEFHIRIFTWEWSYVKFLIWSFTWEILHVPAYHIWYSTCEISTVIFYMEISTCVISCHNPSRSYINSAKFMSRSFSIN